MGCRQSRASTVTTREKEVCDICGKSDSELRRSDFWAQVYCEGHDRGSAGNIRRCCSCQRLEASNVEYINLGDGRLICPDCHSISILQIKQCEPLVLDIQRFFEDHLKLDVKKDIPILLVDTKEMSRVAGHKYRSDCLGAVGRRAGVITTVKSYVRRGNSVEVVAEEKQITGDEVVVILLAFGMPKVISGTTIAHEMMHTWFRLQEWSKGLNREVEEGMCELAAHKWLEHWSPEDDNTKEAKFVKTLRKFELHCIEQRLSKMGHAFREAKWASENYGFGSTLNHIAQNGKLPS